ncbi:fimbrial protein [Enterobacteriaceae bacterium Kacie_13]|nr:fimbrial protein [Enterobacteriaceae bacterium Kacie_13]
MQHKKHSILTTLALAGMISAVSAQAADTTINITATVTAASCTTKAPASIPINFSLNAADVAAAGANSAWSSDATISLSGCPVTTTSIDAVFSGPAVAGDTDGYQMKDSASAAMTSGSIQLAKSDATLITSAKNTYTVNTEGNAAEFKVKARMHSITGNIMPGTYTSAVDVTFAYH